MTRTRTGRVLLALAGAAALVGAACAEDKVVSNTSTQTSVGYERGPGTPGETGAPTSVLGRTPGAGSYTAADPPPAGYRDPDLAVRGDVPLTARIEPGCVEHGQTLHVSARSRRGIYIRIGVVFPNGQFKDLPGHAATAGASGTVNWSVKVTDAANVGEGHVQISARDPDADESGTTGTWDFVVASPGGCQA